MGQESSQVQGKSYEADGLEIKRELEEKDSENLHDISNLVDSGLGERSHRNRAMMPQQRRKKRKRESFSSSNAASGNVRNETETRFSGGERGSPSLPQDRRETAENHGLGGTSSWLSRNPGIVEAGVKKKTLSTAPAVADDARSLSSKAENGRRPPSERLTNLDLRNGRDQSSVNLSQDEDIENHARRGVASQISGRSIPKATQGTKDLSRGKKVKSRKSKSLLSSKSPATDEEVEGANEVQLPTPKSSSQVHGQQALEDPFTDPQYYFRDADTSHEAPRSYNSTPPEIHSARKASSSNKNCLSPFALKREAPSLDRQSPDQVMEHIDPALRSIGMNPDQQPDQIGIHRNNSVPQTTGKRKRRLPVYGDTHDQTPDHVVKVKKPRRKSSKPKTPNTTKQKRIALKREKSPDLDAPAIDVKNSKSRGKKTNVHESTAKGKFSTEELDAIHDEMIKFKEMTGCTMFELNQTIQNSPGKLTSLWKEISQALPDRPRQAIVRVCKRKYHNFEARGVWTIDEDRELKEAYMRFPKRWKEIGLAINRHPEDVRDRWRNYLVCGDSMKREQWTQKEENSLRAVVAECVHAVRELRAIEVAKNPALSQDPRPDINFIDWQIVSEKLGRTRSRLQCLDKWNRMSRIENSDGPPDKPVLESKSWRVKNANKDIKHMKRGDYLELLLALQNTQAGREGKVPWAKLGDLDLRSKWTCMSRKVAWKKLRAGVPGNDRMKFQDIVTLLLNDLSENDDRLEGVDGETGRAPHSPFETHRSSPQKRSLSEAISSVQGDDNGNSDLDLDESKDDYLDPHDIQERHSSASFNHQHSALNRNMLREAVGETYLDGSDTDSVSMDSDVAMANRGSVDLDGPDQGNESGGHVSRLRSPFSFNAAPRQEQSNHVRRSTDSVEEDSDMDIPARRSLWASAPGSVDLDTN